MQKCINRCILTYWHIASRNYKNDSLTTDTNIYTYSTKYIVKHLNIWDCTINYLGSRANTIWDYVRNKYLFSN